MPTNAVPQQPARVNTYAAELRKRRDILGLSLQRIADKGGLAKGSVEAALKDREMRDVPKAENVDGLAKALGVSPRRLRLLIAQSLGLIDDVSPVRSFEPEDLDGLRLDQVDALRRVAAVMREPDPVDAARKGRAEPITHPSRKAARRGKDERT